jgi:hypothetical protein
MQSWRIKIVLVITSELCSPFTTAQCTIVKVVKNARTTMFSHMIPLPFLPSFYADSLSTPGITALARLGHRVNPALFIRIAEIQVAEQERTRECADQQNLFPQAVGGAPPNNQLPLALWQEVALQLRLPNFFVFGLISSLCREAALTVLRYPHVCGHRLVGTMMHFLGTYPGSPTLRITIFWKGSENNVMRRGRQARGTCLSA